MAQFEREQCVVSATPDRPTKKNILQKDNKKKFSLILYLGIDTIGCIAEHSHSTYEIIVKQRRKTIKFSINYHSKTCQFSIHIVPEVQFANRSSLIGMRCDFIVGCRQVDIVVRVVDL